MLKMSFLITRKDLRIALLHGNGTIQAIMLGLILIFLFDFSKNPGEQPSPQEAATIFWLGSIFCQLLIFNQLYSIEEINESRIALLLAPLPVQSIWFGKAIAAFILLLIAQLFFLPAIIIFMSQEITGNMLFDILNLLLANIGICSLGSLLGAISHGKNGRDAVLSIIFFPLLIPLLIAAIRSSAYAFGDSGEDVLQWIGMSAAYDAVFLSAGLVLFNFLYQGGD